MRQFKHVGICERFVKQFNFVGLITFACLLFLFSSLSLQATEITRPFIWVTNEERRDILEKIQTKLWAKELFFQLRQRVEPLASENLARRKALLARIPFQVSNTKSKYLSLPQFRVEGGGNTGQLRRVIKAVQDGVDCGVLFYLTQEIKYAMCGTDILYNIIKALQSIKVNVQAPDDASINKNTGWMFPTDHLYEARAIAAQLPIIYDFVYPHIISGGKAYSLASHQLENFNFTEAQNTFETYVNLVLTSGRADSNWTVFESPSLVHNLLALDDAKKVTKYLPYYLYKDTPRQASLKTISKMFKREGDVWPESFQYSMQVASLSIYLMTILERYDSSLKLSQKYPNILSAFTTYYDLQYPNGEYPFLGDGHRTYTIDYLMLEQSLSLAKINKNEKQINYFNGYLSASLEAKKYNRAKLAKRFHGARPYFTPLQLLWPAGKLNKKAAVDIFRARPRSVRLDFAGVNIQRNTNFNNPSKNSLMAVIGGGSYIHGHASGIAMELYGQGYVLGIDGGKGLYGTKIHENYYRLFAAHNTVISNGASASKSGWLNLGINQVKQVIAEPLPGKKAISSKYSFTTSSFYDQFNLAAPAWHERTLALIKVSNTQGYYVDIFRAKSKYQGQYHDYMYRNIGENLAISAHEKPIALKSDLSRYHAYPNTKWNFHSSYMHPGWQFFRGTHSSGLVDQQMELTYTASKLGDKPILMKAIVPKGMELNLSKTIAPPSKAAPNKYIKEPLHTFVLRKQGEAWDNPFVVIYESSTKEDNFVVQSIERLFDGEVLKGLKLRIGGISEELTQYILFQEDEKDEYINVSENLYFKGRFGIVSVNKKLGVGEAYIGSGSTLRYNDVRVLANKSNMKSFRF